MSRTQKLYLNDIHDSAKAIFEYTAGLSFEEFSKDRKTYAATIREFEIIGEAVGSLSEDAKARFPEVQWQDIKDFRNILAHEYFGVDLEIVWKVVQEDLPELYEVVVKLLEDFD
jgi:uncharacterized protein with HEPN domain